MSTENWIEIVKVLTDKKSTDFDKLIAGGLGITILYFEYKNKENKW